MNTDNWEKEIELIKSIINTTQLTETVKWGATTYTYNNKNIIGVGGFKSYVGIWFFNGVFLEDKKQLLINAQEGKTKSLRQMRFNSITAIDEKTILEYINEAIKIEEKGLSISKEKKELIIPEILNEAFKMNTLLEHAFQQFTPYKQYEFIEYLATAKQEKTKLIRLEKIKPMILSNTGLNDKYRK